MAKNERQIHVSAPQDQIDHAGAATYTNQQYAMLCLDALLQPDTPSEWLHPGFQQDWHGMRLQALSELEHAALHTYDPETMHVVAQHAGIWLKESHFGTTKRRNNYMPNSWLWPKYVGNVPEETERNARRRAMQTHRELAQTADYKRWHWQEFTGRARRAFKVIPAEYRAEYECRPTLVTENVAIREEQRLFYMRERDAHDEAPKRRKVLGKPHNRPMGRFTTSLPKRIREPLLARVQAHAGEPTLARFFAWVWMYAHTSEPGHKVPMTVACKLHAFLAKEHWIDTRDRYLDRHPNPSRFDLVCPRDEMFGESPQWTLVEYLNSP